MSDQQWWMGDDLQWRRGPVPPGYWQAANGRWHPPGPSAAPTPTPGIDDRWAPASSGTGTTGRSPWAPGAVSTYDQHAGSATTSVFPAAIPAGLPGHADPDPALDATERASRPAPAVPLAFFAGNDADDEGDGVGVGVGDPLHSTAGEDRPTGFRNWPTSARVAVGVLALTTVLGFFGAAGASQPEEVQAGAGATEAPTTTAKATTTSPPTMAPTTTATITIAAPTTTVPPATMTTPTTSPSPPPTTAAPAPVQPAVTEPPPTTPPAAAPAGGFANCDEARAAGAAPVHRGDPGYASRLDQDDDGVGCE